MQIRSKRKKIVDKGVNVILDIGLWSSEQRKEIKQFFKEKCVCAEIHCIHIDDESWEKNIQERNKRIDEVGRGMDFYVSDTLKEKMARCWEEPAEDEVGVIYTVDRTKS